ncbi:MAG: hypothetical protein IIV87_03940, partial [Oscillospiraceae bacterium]|nr:hypothetical protein [Oscillospiraceae bacterium]
MKSTKRILALVLALVLLLTPMVSVSAAEATGEDTLYYFDLEAFLNELPSSQVQYDYYKLVTALQGLVNRDKPQLFFKSFNNGVPKKYGYHVDEFWLENITDKESGYGELAAGGDLADYKIVKVKSFWKLLSMFSEYYNGLVVWDANLPSTANVAATIAGVENLLPVRFSKAATDLYVHLMQNGFSKDDIKRDLTGLFSGEGYIPTLGSSVPGAKLEYTTTPSTKSQKTDPYIWAKMFYLDTGLTHPLHMTYSVDAITQAKNTWEQTAEAAAKGEEAKPELAGEIISVYIPETMAPGEVRKFSMTFQNVGTSDWSESTFDRFALTNQLDVFGLYKDSEATKWDTGDRNRIKLTKTVASGDTYQVVGYIKAPKQEGTYTLSLSMEREAVGSISPKYSAKITVKKGGGLSAEDKYVPYEPMFTVDYTTAAKDASIVKVGVGESVAAGSTGKAQVVVKNVGTEAWDSSYALQYTVGSADAKTIAVSGTVASGKTCTFEVPYTAPASGDMSIELQMVNGSETVGSGYTCSVAATGSGSAAESLAAQIVSISAPSVLDGGAKAEAIIEVLNCGTSAWDSTIKLVDTASKGVMSAAGLEGDDKALINSISVEDGITVNPGDSYRFHFDMHSYTNNGTKKVYLLPQTSTVLKLQVQSGTKALTETVDVGFTVLEPCETEQTVYMDASEAKMTGKEYTATMISAAMPKTMEVGELVPIRLTLKNTGTATWTSNVSASSDYLRMAFRGAQNGFGFITNKETGAGDVGDKNRIAIAKGVKVKPGDVYTFTAWLKAPAEAGTYDVKVDGHNDHKQAWVLAEKTFTIKVVDSANLSLSEVEEAQLLALEPEMEVKATTDNIVFHSSADVTTEQYKAVIMSGNVKQTVGVGEKFPVSFTVKNIGTETLKSHLNAPNKPESLRLAFLGNATQFNSANKPQLQPTSVLDANGLMADKFFVLSDSSKTVANEAPWIGAANSEYTRMDLPLGKTFASGESYTYTGYFVAPSKPGTYTIQLVALADGVSPWRSATENLTIKVEKAS